MMESTSQIVINSPMNLPPTTSTLSQKLPLKLSDVAPTPPSRIFQPPPVIPQLPPLPESVKIPGILKPSPPKPQQAINGKVTYVFKPTKYVTQINGSSAPPTFSVSGYRPIRPMTSMIQNPFRPGLYIRSPSKPMQPPQQQQPLPQPSAPQSVTTITPMPRMQRMIRVIQPASHQIGLLSPVRPQQQQPQVSQPVPVQVQNIQAPTIRPLTPKTIEQQPPPSTPKKIYSPPKEYPGEVKRIFMPMIERSARLTPINWKQFREEFKNVNPSETKVLKPWDVQYQPLSNKQRAAKSILNIEKLPQATSISLNSQIGPAGGPLTEKNTVSPIKSPKKSMSITSSDSPPKKYKRKIEPDDKEVVKKKITKFFGKKLPKTEIRYIEPKMFPLRSLQDEYFFTVRQDNISAEDHVYNHIAFNRLLKDGELNFLADMKLSNDPEDMPTMMAQIKSANAKLFKTAAYLDGKTKASKEFPAGINKLLPQLDVPTEEEEKIHPKEFGCARVRPFVRKISSISPTRKRVGKRFTIVTKEDEENMKRAVVRGKHERHFTRQILTQLQIEQPELAKLDIFKSTTTYYKFLKHAKSPIHGDGLFALAPIEPDQMIIEYTGEKVRHEVANFRERKYEKQGLFSSYMFRLDDDWVIDATKMGNLARFINHCCQPNCTARIISRNGVKRIFIFSKTYIEKGEELTYDYKFPLEDNKIRCHCGAKFCRNFLN
uniref:Histone-lysine N-methyltransferase n=1 Tax=Panagrolaimus sp. ES5 TaxID=591445 RepID=A0AC34GRP7_9BILA